QVSIVGAERGTLTDEAGRFQLDAGGAAVQLEFVMIGYRTLVERVEPGTSDLRIELEPTAMALDEIVVTGTPGGVQARAMGNVVAQVDAAELVRMAPPADVQAMLSAQVPGLRIQRAGGAVGVGGKIGRAH